MTLRTRHRTASAALLFAALLASGDAPVPATPETPTAPKPTPAMTPLRDGQRDFDFLIGKWKYHLKRLQNPLTGSTAWTEFDGTGLCRPVWNGNAQIDELDVNGPGGHIQGLTLRLYNPQSRLWSLNWANAADGALAVPTIGSFKDGRGEFYDQEDGGGRAVLVQFVITPLGPDSCRFEQSFSDDGGKTWELNWVAVDTRVREAR